MPSSVYLLGFSVHPGSASHRERRNVQSDLSFFANFSRSPLLTCDTPCLFICFKLISSDCFNNQHAATVDLSR